VTPGVEVAASPGAAYGPPAPGAVEDVHRGRRLRRTPALRALVRETRLSAAQLVLPLFVREGRNVRRPVASMPGVAQTSVDECVRDAAAAAALGVGGVLLFGVPDAKDDAGTGAWADDGPVARAVHALKAEVPDLVVVTDVCLCEYTSHGHCGLLAPDGGVDNDRTLPLLARAAVAHASAGADVVAPSDMMDGRVRAVRAALDRAGYAETPLMSYAVKYASAFYGPFRDAAESAPQHGDRRGYQMDPANGREALREARADVAEGADMLMVKPAGAYLDVLAAVRREVEVPVAAYQVSGEYAMLRAAAERGWIDGERAMRESLVAIARAGADLIVTYAAAETARGLAAER
jgi:porphobilinogen synthase